MNEYLDEIYTTYINGNISVAKKMIAELTNNQLVELFAIFVDMDGVDKAIKSMDILTR